MSTTDPGQVTRVLVELAGGDKSAGDRLLPLVYEELRALARAHMARERDDHILQPTALVHEAYIRLVQTDDIEFNGRHHFFAVAATAIRRVLVDHARGRDSLKRGGSWQRVTLTDAVHASDQSSIDLLALDDALHKLEELDSRKSRVVELRFFAGLTTDQVAETMGLSNTTIEGDWRIARSFLRAQLAVGESSET